MRFTAALLLLVLSHAASPAATYQWSGSGDGLSFFQEANWTLVGGTTAIPQIDPNIALLHDLLVEADTPGGPNGFAAHLRLGGRTLTLSGGTIRAAQASSAGIHNDGTSGGSRAPLVISGGELLSHFLTDVAARLAGSAVLTLWSGGDPLANSTLELASTFTGQIRFTSETPATVRAEHLAKITVGGAAASENVNLRLTPDGASGCVVTVVAADADQDAMPDAWEILHFANTARDGTGDFDQDGLVDLAEFQRGTLPTNPDSDGDTLTDGAEVTTGTHPLASDSDADGLTDNVETGTGTYLSATDTGTSPLNPNTDGDRLRDGGEVAKHSDPNNPADCPALPNVVVILADDLGYNHLGAYRQRSNQTRGTNYDLTLAPTPRIDSLAAAGMLFTDAYAGCTVCGPSRSSLQSGIHSGHIPFKVNNAYVDVTRRTVFLGEIFQRAGFATGYFGKWGLGGAGSGQTPNDRGYAEFLGMNDHGHGHIHYPGYLIHNQTKIATGNTTRDGKRTSLNAVDRVHHSHELFTSAALQFIDDHADEAFLCFFSPTLVHSEIIATDAAVAPSLAKGWPEYNVGDNGTHYPQTKPRAHFAGMMKMLDDSVGAILDRLASHGLTENTLVLFASDNGGQLQSVWGSVPSTWFDANGTLRGGKEDSYEGGLRVPMLVRWPGRVAAGSVSSLPLYFADLLPTFCEVLDTDPPAYSDGLSILPTCLGNPAGQLKHSSLYWCHSHGGVIDHAVRSGHWKAVKRGSNALELYHLTTDPAEVSNLASSQPSIATSMQAIIDREYMPDLTEPKASANSPVYPYDP